MNATTELFAPAGLINVTLDPVVLARPTVVGFVVTCTMQVAVVN
jgi:hypothetical protein